LLDCSHADPRQLLAKLIARCGGGYVKDATISDTGSRRPQGRCRGWRCPA